MTPTSIQEVSVGAYKGVLAENYRFPEFLSQVQDLSRRVSEAWKGDAVPRRNRNVRLTFTRDGVAFGVAVKVFGRQPLVKDWIDTFKGSRARRSWLAACHLRAQNIGTPPPIGFLERWDGGRLVESYYLAEYQDKISSFRDELIHLFHDEPECDKFMSLMQCVAEAVRAMHETGFLHNDLGNQNILLKRIDQNTWGGVQFIDLNRARMREHLSIGARARDISRLYLPSDFLRIFVDMYYRGALPPNEFREAERFHRRLYGWHSNTRKWRHPIRTSRIREAEQGMKTYPLEKDMWVWDWRSGQAISAMRPRDRSRFHTKRRYLQVARATASGFFPVWRQYEELLGAVYQSPVPMKDRIGMTLHPERETLGRELGELRNLGRLPVFVRFYHHEPAATWEFTAAVLKDLHAEGYPVSIALVQDRRAVTDPARWRSFLAAVLGPLHDIVDWVEVGHAINRVKWGIWDFEEHRRLLDGVADAAKAFPGVKFMGPAVIDFEYPDLMGALRNMPPSLRFGALSHHLYVDRRGAPESQQGVFAAIDKFALARGIARWSGVCDDKVIVSEVSWPIRGTGVFSPVGSPHDSPGPRHNDPSVSEDEYADYMMRYLLIAVCSGMIDRVYWWRLASRGFGLVDDTDASRWRERPAYHLLKYFLATLGDSTFVQRVDARACLSPQDRPRVEGVYLFMFQKPAGGRVCMAYSSVGPMTIVLPFECDQVRDGFGKSLPIQADRQTVSIDGRPIYAFVR